VPDLQLTRLNVELYFCESSVSLDKHHKSSEGRTSASVVKYCTVLDDIRDLNVLSIRNAMVYVQCFDSLEYLNWKWPRYV